MARCKHSAASRASRARDPHWLEGPERRRRVEGKADFIPRAGTVHRCRRPDCAPGASGMAGTPAGTSLCPSAAQAKVSTGLNSQSVASAVRARQIFARWREQYRQVRERLAQSETDSRPEPLAVASSARARRIFARCREQYKLVRERLARISNAAIALRSRPEAKKMAGRGTSHKVVIDNYNQRRTS